MLFRSTKLFFAIVFLTISQAMAQKMATLPDEVVIGQKLF